MFDVEYRIVVERVADQLVEQRACNPGCAACLTDAEDIIALIVGPVEVLL